MKNIIVLISFITFLQIYKFSVSLDLKNNEEFKNLINNYYLDNEMDIEEIQTDTFVENYINNNSTKYYKLFILNDTEEIYFDFQSEYGCLNIDIKENISNYSFSNLFEFCSQGVNNIFNLSKNEIQKIIKNKETIDNLNIIIKAKFPPLINQNSKIYYSLKVSLKKPDINIIEINSFHKILCKTEKINDKNLCLLMLNIKENDFEQFNKDLIVYSNSQSNNFKLNISADYINNEKYDEWDYNYLLDNIPNETSIYNNYLNDNEFIIIPNFNNDKYIYISIESNTETNIEVIVNIINNSISPKINQFYIYSINNISKYIELDFKEQKNDISLYIGALTGKGSIHFNNDESKEYIVDTIENKLIINFNKELLNISSYSLIINNLEQNDEKGLGFIFYVYFENRNNILNKISNGKSSKILNNIPEYPLLLYEKISEEDLPLNLNLQLYNFSLIDFYTNNSLDIEIMILSKEEIYELKLDYENIKKYKKIIKKFDNVLSASNIYLNSDNISYLNISEDSWLVVHIPIYNISKEVILGCSLLSINNLNYLSERIYHFGKINNGEKVVYKLKGNKNYHLMRLEFACNSEYIGWSVKRTNENENYKNNDTDLSFVTEKWINGRELLTMFIENGEDIFLTVFKKEKLDNNNLTNHAFKYINSGKNGDFKNYLIKHDSLEFDKKDNVIIITKLSNIPNTSTIDYYLKIIKKEDYIENESINTIAITQSNSNLGVKCYSYGTKTNIICDLKNFAKEVNTYYVNVYSIINENNDIESVSYSSLIFRIKDKSKERNSIIILISLCFGGLIVIFLILSIIIYCIRKNRRRNYNYSRYRYRDYSY